MSSSARPQQEDGETCTCGGQETRQTSEGWREMSAMLGAVLMSAPRPSWRSFLMFLVEQLDLLQLQSRLQQPDLISGCDDTGSAAPAAAWTLDGWMESGCYCCC